jgi:1-acyl-sn-glycerol-3-phosphate acyltransferase/MFS family permease
MPSNQFALLVQRRFGPFFLTQFLAAANDTLLKFALTLLVSAGLSIEGLDAKVAGPLIGMMYLLPFVLISLVAGPWIDKVDKAWLIRWLKLLEVLVMATAAWGFWAHQSECLLGSVMGLGVHGALFGPAKYAYLPEQLRTRELMGGNGITLAGTYLAMLFGNLLGVALVAKGADGAVWVGWACCLMAVAGWVISLGLPAAPSRVPNQVVSHNPLLELSRSLAEARRDPSLFQSLLGLGWMWFVAAFYLGQLPVLVRDVLGGDPSLGALMLMVFGSGLLIASVFCEVMSRQNVEIGLVLIGAMCMGSFGGDLYFATHDWVRTPGAPMLDAAGFWARHGSWRILYDLFRLALGLGFFAAPLFAFIQWRAQPGHCARLMALGNLINAVFLVGGMGVSASLLKLGLTLPQMFFVGALLNTVAVLYFFIKMPEGLARLAVLVTARFMYRMPVKGLDAWPLTGPALMVCNHGTVIDALFVSIPSPRPLLILGDPAMLSAKGMGWFFKRNPAVPLISAEIDPVAYECAVKRARQALDDGQLVCVFAEGKLTPDGKLQPFIDVVPSIIEQRRVPVFPVALHNLWGSYFSRIEGEPMRKPLRRGISSRLGIVMGAAIPGPEATTERLHAEVARLLAEPRP